MEKLDVQILKLFQEQSSLDISTNTIVQSLFSNEQLEPTEISDKKEIKLIKRKKAQLHRKVLYHLNKLVDEKILRISKEGIKGKKYFVLNIDLGEEIRYKKNIVITKKSFPQANIEGYEQNGMIHFFDPELWTRRLNSILIECNKFSGLSELGGKCANLILEINDSLALNNFESLLKDCEIESLKKFIEKLDSSCIHTGKTASIIIESKNFDEKNKKEIQQFLEVYTNIKPKKLRTIFNVSHKTINKHPRFFEYILELFVSSRLKCYFKNNLLHDSPYFIGKAGPYAISDSDWLSYLENLNEKLKGMAVGHSTILFDIKKFLEMETRLYKFEDICLEGAKTLFSINKSQRKHAKEYFKESLKDISLNEFFRVSKNFIRIWNYSETKLKHSEIICMLLNANIAIKSFCDTQNIIYQSCGMPARFSVALASSCANFTRPRLDESKIKKLIITRIEDFYIKKNIELLEESEAFFNVFKGGKRLRIYHMGNKKGSNILRELNFLLITYRIPFFCFDFTDIKSTRMNLKEYLDDGNN